MDDDKALIPTTRATPSNGSKNGQRKVTSWTPDQARVIEWLSAPRQLRIPKTQGELAKEIGVSRVAVWEWKQKPGFADAVIDKTRQRVKANDVTDILDTHVARAKEGEVDSAKMILQATNVLGDTHTDKSPTVQVLIVNQAEPGQEAIDAIAD